MNTMSEKVKKIMAIVIDCCMTKEDAMEVLRLKYDWLYPYITESVWSEHYNLYMKSKGLLVDEPEDIINAEFLKQLARRVNVSPDDEYIKSAIEHITNST